MGYYVVNHSGQTRVNVGSEKEPNMAKVKYKKGEPVEDVNKGDLDHVKGAEYHTGTPDGKESKKKAKKKSN